MLVLLISCFNGRWHTPRRRRLLCWCQGGSVGRSILLASMPGGRLSLTGIPRGLGVWAAAHHAVAALALPLSRLGPSVRVVLFLCRHCCAVWSASSSFSVTIPTGKVTNLPAESSDLSIVASLRPTLGVRARRRILGLDTPEPTHSFLLFVSLSVLCWPSYSKIRLIRI